MHKKLSLLIMTLIVLLTACSFEPREKDVYKTIVKKDKIVVGVKYDAKPFGFIDKDGQLNGFDVDIAKSITKRLLGDSSKVEFVQVTPASRIQAVNSGEVDIVIATMSITPERMRMVDFSNSYYLAGQAVLVRKNCDINSFSDLNGKKVIIILGTTGEKTIRIFAPHAILIGYKNYREAFNALKDGEANAITTDDSLLLGFLMDNPDYKIIPKRLTEEHYGVAFRKSEDTDILKKHINNVLNSMRDDGSINKLKKKWNI